MAKASRATERDDDETHLSVRSIPPRFRRCGIEFTPVARAYEIAALEEQGEGTTARLEAEPLLVCQRVTEEAAERMGEGIARVGEMTRDELQAEVVALRTEVAELRAAEKHRQSLRSRVADRPPADPGRTTPDGRKVANVDVDAGTQRPTLATTPGPAPAPAKAE